MAAPGDLERDATFEQVDHPKYGKPTQCKALLKNGARYDQLTFLPLIGGVPVAVTASNITAMSADSAGLLNITTTSAKYRLQLGDAVAAKQWQEALVKLGAKAA